MMVIIRTNENEAEKETMSFINQTKDDPESQSHQYKILYDLAFNKSTSPMSIFDYETNRYLDVNPAFLDAFEYKREDIIGKTTAEIHLYEEPEIRKFLIDSLVKTGHVKAEKMKILTKYGDRRVGNLAAEVFELNGKKYIYSVMNDLTESVSIKAKIIKNEKLYRKINENISDVVIIINKDRENTYVSPNVKRLFGVDPSDMIGFKNFQYAHVDERNKMAELFRTLVEKGPGSEVSLEGRFLKPDGSNVIVELTAKNLMDDPVIQGIMSTFHDITQRKILENTIEEDGERYRALIESSDALIWVVDPVHFGLVTYNSSFIRYFRDLRGINVEPGQPPEKLVPPELVEVWYGMYRKAMTEGPFVTIYETASKIKYLRLSLYPVTNRGEVTGISVFGDDITPIVEAKSELEKANATLHDTLMKTISVISKIAEYRDPYTAGHQVRVQKLSEAIAMKLGLSKDEIETISMAAAIHDIGKINIPSDILNKPGKITALEYQILQSHAEIGYDIAKNTNFHSDLDTYIHQHHERLDGTGYPLGISEKDILMGSRIIAVADTVEAMTAHRPYRPALGIDAALAEIEDHQGSHYDRRVVEACLTLFRKEGFTFE